MHTRDCGSVLLLNVVMITELSRQPCSAFSPRELHGGTVQIDAPAVVPSRPRYDHA
ncbi:hypothetical protein SESBI_36884 [Sesbania bispinosa]|nr:hypothetical protein SESBI_36884 [Sesbania bispinosa]